jgi:hypothetical protein
MKPSTAYVRIEATIAGLAGLLGFGTAFWHGWIEALTGWDPDQHSGSLEWLLVGILLATALGMGLQARHHWRALAASSE